MPGIIPLSPPVFQKPRVFGTRVPAGAGPVQSFAVNPVRSGRKQRQRQRDVLRKSPIRLAHICIYE